MIDFKDNISSIIDFYDKIINNLAPKERELINNLTPTVKVLLGEALAGKTSIISRYINNIFDENIMPNTSPYYVKKTDWFEEENQSIEFEIWDTSGIYKYRALTKTFYKYANVCVLVYDITRI